MFSMQLADNRRCPYTKAEYLPEKIISHTHTHTLASYFVALQF
jgi:hypothetical protein